MKQNTHDVIVVGARCAGAPTAMLLARKGYKVLLVDRASFPSDVPRGNYIHRDGPQRLARWGLLDRLAATNCPPITALTMDLGDFPLTGQDLCTDGVPLGLAPRRIVLDKLLVDAAIEAGAEFRDHYEVDEFTTDGDRITGVRSRATGTGCATADRATVTVGADGRRSRLARFVDASVYDAVPAAACAYFSFWSGVAIDHCEVYWRRDKGLFAVPTNDALSAVFVEWPAGQLPAIRANIERSFMAALDEVPTLGDRVRCGRREERFLAATDLDNFFRKPFGPGWALVGDAGYHKDPSLALGISDAFRDAELLAEALHRGLSGLEPLEGALARYERERNVVSREDYRLSVHAAQFKPAPDEMYRLRAAVRGDQAATNRFFMAREGLIPRETFFNPENMAQLLEHAV